MSWSPAQQAMLSAMGYTLHARVAPAAAPVVAAAAAEASRAHEAPAMPASRREAAPARADRLRQALERAARGRRLDTVMPPLDQLRASPAAKRAFWPVLRALRRG